MHTERIFRFNQNIRKSARAIIVEDGKILLVKNDKYDIYMLPGGGMEGDESVEECCIREVLEETGYICKTIFSDLKIEEYHSGLCFLGQYFICEITGKGERNLTDYEKETGCSVEWMNFEQARTMFANYKKYSDYWEKESTYLRDHTALSHYFENK